jgi:hypothetical protein
MAESAAGSSTSSLQQSAISNQQSALSRQQNPEPLTADS